MVNLRDIVPIDLMNDMIRQEYINVSRHPTLPLVIYNYSKSAQYDRVWNAATLACRGLIVSEDSGDVVARPLAKFFTWGQPECPDIPLDAGVHVADKADGSLGILYPTGDAWAIATRGSFTSDQAKHATNILRTKYPKFSPAFDHTYLFEIVYPGNRIVLDYGDTDDLIFLGAVANSIGDFFPCDGSSQSVRFGWNGRHAKSFGWMKFSEALAIPPRANAEGVVLLRPVTGDMVKIKQADYVALHRIMTSVSARTLWEFLAVNAIHSDGDPAKVTASKLRMDPRRVEQIIAVGPGWEAEYIADRLPDEFHVWVQKTIRSLVHSVNLVIGVLIDQFDEINARVGEDRKTFAAAVADRDDRGLMFALFNNQDITASVWRLMYPPAEKPFDRPEEVA